VPGSKGVASAPGEQAPGDLAVSAFLVTASPYSCQAGAFASLRRRS
jgi:hypothetical protein